MGNYEIKKFGTLVVQNPYYPKTIDPENTLHTYWGGTYQFCDSEDGKEISWVYIPAMDIYVANRCIVKGISWNVLNLQGYTHGKRIVIDGHVYNCRLLRAKEDCAGETEWEKILKETADDVTLWHHDIMSWGDDTGKQRDYRKAFGRDNCRWLKAGTQYEDCGFRPILEPMLTDKKMNFSANGKLGSTQFGTLCLDGIPLSYKESSEIQRWNGERISFADSRVGKGLPWLYVKEDNFFISKQCVLKNISWSDLYEQGFVEGKRIKINDREYICRIPYANPVGATSEWDKVVALARGKDKFPTKNIYTWAIDAVSDESDEKILRGYCMPNSWNSINKDVRDSDIGVRFVLQPV